MKVQYHGSGLERDTLLDAPTSAGEWAPVEFGGNLRARLSLDRGPGGVLRPPAPRPSLRCFWPELVLRSRVRVTMTGVRPCELVRAADGRSSPQEDDFADSNASVLVRGVCDRRWLAGRGTGPGTFSRTFEAFGRPPLACRHFCMTECIATDLTT